MTCSGRWLVRYGSHVEVYSEESGDLLASFRVVKDMCKETFDIYLAVRHNVTEPYRLRKIK